MYDIHGWQLHTSMDDTSIHGWKCHLSDFAYVLQSFGVAQFHIWMKKSHPWMKVSSVDIIHGWRNLINGWHPQIKMADDRHRRSQGVGTFWKIDEFEFTIWPPLFDLYPQFCLAIIFPDIEKQKKPQLKLLADWKKHYAIRCKFLLWIFYGVFRCIVLQPQIWAWIYVTFKSRSL